MAISNTKAGLNDLLKKKILKRCVEDPLFFIENFVYIETTPYNGEFQGIPGVYKFTPYEYQRTFTKNYFKYDYNIVVKSRQLGFTTMIAALCAWLLIFRKSFSIIFVSKTQPTADEFIDRLKLIVNKLPDWLRPANFINDNVRALKLTNRSSIKSFGGKSNVRGFTANLVIFDEAAFIPNFSKMITSALPVISRTKGKCIVLSTPDGPNGKYYESYREAELKKSMFHPMECPWWENPDYINDLVIDPTFPGGYKSTWAEEEFRKNPDQNSFLQEYCCSFNSSNNMFFASNSLDIIAKNSIEEPIIAVRHSFFDDIPMVMKDENDLWFWRLPELGREYIMAIDIARGDSRDKTAIEVFDKLSYEQVAEYNGKIDTIDAANLAVYIARKYNDAMIIPENNSIGWSTVQEIIQQEYTNLFYAPKNWDNVFRPNYMYEDYSTARNVPGFQTSSKTRPLILNQLKEDINNQDIIIRSKRLIFEMENFIWNGSKPEAKENKNDDLVISTAILAFVRAVFLYQVNINSDVASTLIKAYIKEQKPVDFSVGSELRQRERNINKSNYMEFGWLAK